MILILTQCFPPTSGGIEGLMGGLARELAAAGRDVLVFADAHKQADAFDSSIRERYSIKRFGGVKPLRRRLKARAASQLIRNDEVDGVFADSWKSLEMLNRAVLRKAGTPVIVWSHGNEYPANPTPAKRRRIVAALSAATRILANSAYTRARIAEFVPDGVDVVLRHPPTDLPDQPENADLEWAEELWGAQGPRLVSVSRLDPRKGLDSVIRCLPDLSLGHPNIRYVIAGSGGDRDRLEALAKEIGVGKLVRFAGRVDGARKSALYATSDLFVMPTRPISGYAETFGIVFPEAAYFGVPAVAGQAGGSADAVADGETGVLCDGDDPSAVSAAIGRMVDDANLRKRLGDAARSRGAKSVWRESIGPFLADIDDPKRA